jgi:hypothetical protein
VRGFKASGISRTRPISKSPFSISDDFTLTCFSEAEVMGEFSGCDALVKHRAVARFHLFLNMQGTTRLVSLGCRAS